MRIPATNKLASHPVAVRLYFACLLPDQMRLAPQLKRACLLSSVQRLAYARPSLASKHICISLYRSVSRLADLYAAAGVLLVCVYFLCSFAAPLLFTVDASMNDHGVGLGRA